MEKTEEEEGINMFVQSKKDLINWGVSTEICTKNEDQGGGMDQHVLQVRLEQEGPHQQGGLHEDLSQECPVWHRRPSEPNTAPVWERVALGGDCLVR
jgi:hypothetical protein